jgi:hypothetical protein
MPGDEDDGSVPQDAGLLRRIHPDHVVADENTGQSRPSSAAFRDSEMSVDAEPVLTANGRDWHFTLQGYPQYSLVRFRASIAREKGLAVVPKPLPTNSAHTIVRGNKTRSISHHLRDNAEWVHLEGNVDEG